jgi:hypothetical protein
MRILVLILFASAAFAAKAQNEVWQISLAPQPCYGFEGQSRCYWLKAPDDSTFQYIYDPVVNADEIGIDTCDVLIEKRLIQHPAADQSSVEYHIKHIIRCNNE